MPTSSNNINHIKLKLLKKADYKQIIELQLKCFPGMKPWSESQFSNLLQIFQQGQVGIVVQKKL